MRMITSGLACFAEDVFVLAVADNQRAFSVALSFHKLEAAASGIDGDEGDGPIIVFAGCYGALPSVEIKTRVDALVVDFEVTERGACVVHSKLCCFLTSVLSKK